MRENNPTLKQWQELYGTFLRVKEIEPWRWMEEIDIFGVQDPESGEIGFVSVMGTLGEHYAVAVYLGQEGLYGFWGFQEMEPDFPAEHLMEVPQIQASLENRKFLDEEDREVIRNLGLTFRGKQAWPLFRSYRPGFVPWSLEAEEARFLTHALEQTIDVALRFKEDESLLMMPDEETYLVRVPLKKKRGLVWEDRMVRVSPPEPYQIPVEVDSETLDALTRLPAKKTSLEVDLFMFPSMVWESSSRPFYTYILLVVDGHTGQILGHDPLIADPSMEAMWGLIPGLVAKHLLKLGFLPQEIKVRSELMHTLLSTFVEELGVKLNPTRNLRKLDTARKAMLEEFS
ncbi:MAG: hypothetical protein ACE5OP_13225 [Candidatus Glassbacteria bacterium]